MFRSDGTGFNDLSGTVPEELVFSNNLAGELPLEVGKSCELGLVIQYA